MDKFLTILKHEFLQIVKKKTFLVMIFLTPVFMAVIMLLPAYLATKGVSSSESIAIIDRGNSSVGQNFSEKLREYTLPDDSTPAYSIAGIFELANDDEERFEHLYDSLTQEIANKNLHYVLLVDRNAHLDDNNLHLVTNSDNFRAIRRFETELTGILSGQRLRLSNINLPVDSVLALTQRLDLTLKDTKGDAIPFIAKYFGALIFVMLMYMMIITNGATLMRSVIEEKSSRIMEVLISSVSPFQLMLGKVLGMGLAAFTQVAVWVLIGLAIFLVGNSTTLEINSIITRIVFDPVIIIFFVLFFVTGYIMYSTIFALIGSIVNSDKEAQHFIFPISMCLIAPVIVGIAVQQDPHATWVMVMTYIPFITPTMMMMRVIFIAPTVTSYSFFSGILAEATIGLILVTITALAVIWLTSRIFRIGILMYGKRPTLPELIKWVRHA